MNLKIKYLGLELDNPTIAASSPFTSSLDKLRSLEDAGIGAVVLKSVFEEQVSGEAAHLEQYSDYPEAADYLQAYVTNDYVNGHLRLIEDARQSLAIPVIASINCAGAGKWVEYAKFIEKAGADALELNISIRTSSLAEKPEDIEARHLDIVSAVTEAIKIPVSVKLGMQFTNVLALCRDIYYRGARGVVMFNRFFEPDIDIENMELVSAEPLSLNGELRNVLRSVAYASSRVPQLDIAASTGIHDGRDAVKAILAGAKTVQLCTALYTHGLQEIEGMKRFMAEWMDARGFSSPEDFRGRLSPRNDAGNEFFQRAQYMKWFPKA